MWLLGTMVSPGLHPRVEGRRRKKRDDHVDPETEGPGKSGSHRDRGVHSHLPFADLEWMSKDPSVP